MKTNLEKAKFYISTEEFDKAETILSDLFDSGESGSDIVSLLVICKIANSGFDTSKMSAAKVHLESLRKGLKPGVDLDGFIELVLAQLAHYVKRINDVFYKEANELVKRPALDDQFYAVKVLSDTTAYMQFINNNVDKYNRVIVVAELLYEMSIRKEHVAHQIVNIIDNILNSIKSTPSMTGKTLLDAKGLDELKDSRSHWANLAGGAKEDLLQSSPAETGGCLVMFALMFGALVVAGISGIYLVA